MAMETSGTGNLRRNGKSRSAYRTISEVSNEIDVPAHVLRFWETKFPQIRPLKRGGGRRYYRQEDVSLLRQIRQLLYSDGYTIKGVQRLLKEGPPKDATQPSRLTDNKLADQNKSFEDDVSSKNKPALRTILKELRMLREILSTALDK